MGYTLINGKQIAEDVRNELALEVAELKAKNITPALAVIIVGNYEPSKIYVSSKKKACASVGIDSISYELPEETTEDELIEVIKELNNRPDVSGILLQLPLPKRLNPKRALLAIDPKKDVDGLHPFNAGLISTGDAYFEPCTPSGVIEMLKRSGVKIEGANCVVLGRSNLVGVPAALLLMRENGTVTICHSRTKNLEALCSEADILVPAIGKPRFVTANMVKEGAVVIDVGINRLENRVICGDVDFDDVKDKVSMISPVPKGVGPMTIAMLLKNCVKACKLANNLL